MTTLVTALSASTGTSGNQSMRGARWLSEGIGGENLRKIISGDHSGAKPGDAKKLSDALIHSVYGSKQKIKFGKILEDHGLYAPFGMHNNLQYIVTLPYDTNIMIAQSSEAVRGYTLENLELEYETMENANLANEVTSLYACGRSLSYEHCTLMKSVEWGEDDPYKKNTQ